MERSSVLLGSGEPPAWAILLPGYGPARMIVDGAFAGRFHAWTELLVGLAWILVLSLAVVAVLGRLVGLARDTGSPSLR